MMMKMILFLSKMRMRMRARAKMLRMRGMINLRTNQSIDDEFNPEDFFDDMNDERAFEALYR